ncbi:hypothetical protein WJX74_009684 [Apatococcus lobatus]|uniref:Codanin-1 C-terminal domain-containing protein n=1 Tax=Apatococcus lobatus TaxID=904363 RepID=A0AAW1S0D6_9CHLO
MQGMEISPDFWSKETAAELEFLKRIRAEAETLLAEADRQQEQERRSLKLREQKSAGSPASAGPPASQPALALTSLNFPSLSPSPTIKEGSGHGQPQPSSRWPVSNNHTSHSAATALAARLQQPAAAPSPGASRADASASIPSMPSGRKQSRRKIAPTRIALADKEPAFQEASSSLKEDLQTPASSPQARMSKPTMLDGSCPNRGPRQLPSDAASSCQPEVVKHGNVAIGNSAAAINSPLQGIKSWRQAVESPTTAWIRQAGSPVNSISNAHAASHPSAAQAHSHPTSDPPATELHSKPARERSSSPVSRGTSHANSNPAPLAGPSRFSPAQSHASFQGQSPVTTQHSTNVVMSGAWGAGPPRTRPGSMSSPRSGASQPVGDAERPITSDAAAVAQASCRQVYEPSGKSASPGKPLRAALQGGSGKSAGRRPMHPQAHALASTGSSKPNSHLQSQLHQNQLPPRMPSRIICSAENHSNSSSVAACDPHQTTHQTAHPSVGVTTLPVGLGSGQTLLLGSPQSSTSSCSVTFSRPDGLVSPGSAAQPRSAPPTPSANKGPTHRPDTPAKKRLSLVPTPPPSSPPSCHPCAENGHSPRLFAGQSSVTASDRHVARAPLRYEVMVIKEQDLQTASNVQAFEGAIPLCTPMKAPVRKASQQGVDFPSAEKSAASSVEAQASSTEAVVESSREEIQGRSPDCTSPGDASSPGIQFPARPVLGQSTCMLHHGHDSSTQQDDRAASWSAPSLSHALEAAAADAQPASVATSKGLLTADSQAGLVDEQQEYGEADLGLEGCQLADVHGIALAHSPHISLAAEMELLLHMLAIPATVGSSLKPKAHCDSDSQSVEEKAVAGSPDARQPVMDQPGALGGKLRTNKLLRTGQHAHIFACCVLEHAGNLPTSMGLSVMEALAAHPAMQEHAPKLLEQLQSRMHQLSSSSSIGAGLTPHNQRRTSLGSFPGLLGLSGLTLDAHASASQDERRRISNREHCRDDWLACLRTAASQGGLFAFISSPQTGPGSHSSLLAPHGSREAAFAEMQKGAAAVLRRLRPDNMRDFAELVTQGLLQAAATGEALLDDELAGLARRDPSRFQRLNQRLQASQGPRQQHNGMVSPSAGAASRGSARGSMAGYGAEGTTASLAAIDEFPAALRLHAMFIEAADSYRLNQHLMRCMVAKLKALTSAGGASAPSQSAMSEKLAMQCALALFISHMHFAERSQPGDTADRLPLDVMAALQGDLPAVASALAWVTRLFWFATRDEAAIVSQQMQAIKLTLASLRCQAQLRPSHAGFTTAAFIVRALLDELMPRLGMESSMLLPPTREADARSGNGGEPGGASRGGGDGIGAVQRKLPASEARNLTFGKGEEANLAAAGVSSQALLRRESPHGSWLMDQRVLQLCCPQLDTARQALQASLKGTSQSSSVKTSQRPSRKITPALPRRTPLAASISIPPALQAIAQGESDPLQLKLQQAFLDQYSASHHTVKLRALVEYLTDVVTANACSSALAGVQDIAAVPANAGSSHASGLRDGPVLQQALMELQARALCHLKRAVGQALPALAAPEWPVAAVAAASALVAGRAEAAAAQRLISEAPARVQQAMASLARSETISASKSAGVPPKGPAGPN